MIHDGFMYTILTQLQNMFAWSKLSQVLRPACDEDWYLSPLICHRGPGSTLCGKEQGQSSAYGFIGFHHPFILSSSFHPFITVSFSFHRFIILPSFHHPLIIVSSSFHQPFIILSSMSGGAELLQAKLSVMHCSRGRSDGHHFHC